MFESRFPGWETLSSLCGNKYSYRKTGHFELCIQLLIALLIKLLAMSRLGKKHQALWISSCSNHLPDTKERHLGKDHAKWVDHRTKMTIKQNVQGARTSIRPGPTIPSQYPVSTKSPVVALPDPLEESSICLWFPSSCGRWCTNWIIILARRVF